MTEEIKELLDILNKVKDYDDKRYFISCGENDYLLTNDEIKCLLNYITNLQKENELHNKILKDANDVLNIQAQKGNYNYDRYMLGLYNGMEMIVSLFEQREPKFKCGKDIKFLHETDYKQRNEKAIEFIKEWWYEKNTRDINRIVSLGDKRIDLLNILKGDDE